MIPAFPPSYFLLLTPHSLLVFYGINTNWTASKRRGPRRHDPIP